MNDKIGVIKQRMGLAKAKVKPASDVVAENKQLDFSGTAKPSAPQPLSISGGSSIPGASKYKESGREIVAAGAPQQHEPRVPGGIIPSGFVPPRRQQDQTDDQYRTATKEAELQHRTRGEQADARAEAKTQQYGQAESFVKQGQKWRAPWRIDDAIRRTADMANEYTNNPGKYPLWHQAAVAGDFANMFHQATPLEDIATQNADQRGHAINMAARDADKFSEQRDRFTQTGSTPGMYFSPRAGVTDNVGPANPGQTHWKHIPNIVSPLSSKTEEEVQAIYPKLANLAQVKQDNAGLLQNHPSVGRGIIGARQTDRVAPGGQSNPGINNSLQNTAKENAMSHAYVFDSRAAHEQYDKQGKRYPVSQNTPKDTAQGITFPHHGNETLYFGHQPPVINHDKINQDLKDPSNSEKQSKSSDEKKNMQTTLHGANEHLRQAIDHFAAGRMNDGFTHMNMAAQIAPRGHQVDHAKLDEMKNANGFLKDLPGAIEQLQQNAKGGKSVINGLRLLRDHATKHVEDIHHTGKAFDNSHLVRPEASQQFTPENISRLQEKNPDSPIVANPNEVRGSASSLVTNKQQEKDHPIVRGHEAHDPEQMFGIMQRHLSRFDKTNPFQQELKDYLEAGPVRYLTHPHEFGQKPAHMYDESFLGQVPLEQVSNYLDSGDDMSVNYQGKNMPLKEAAQAMTGHILNAGFNGLDEGQKTDYQALRHKQSANLPMNEQENSNIKLLSDKIRRFGISSLTNAHAFRNQNDSNQDMQLLNAMRFMAANRHRKSQVMASHTRKATNNILSQQGDNPDAAISALNDLLGQTKPFQTNWQEGGYKHLPNENRHAWETSGIQTKYPPRIAESRDELKRALTEMHNRKKGSTQKSMPTLVKSYQERAAKLKNNPLEKSVKTFKERIAGLKKSILALGNAPAPQGHAIESPGGGRVIADSGSNQVKAQTKASTEAHQRIQSAPTIKYHGHVEPFRGDPDKMKRETKAAEAMSVFGKRN